MSYTCVESDWSLRYSSDWYPSDIELEGQPSTFRLIRKLNGHRLVVAFTVLSAAGCEYNVDAPGVIAKAHRAVFKQGLPDADIELAKSGVTTISSCRVPWYDVTVERPLRDTDWNRFYWLQSGEHVWMIQLSTHFERAHIDAALLLWESVRGSITVEAQDSPGADKSPMPSTKPD